MSTKKTQKSQMQGAEMSSQDSRNAQNGYMSRGNASKIAADQGTRNKN